MLVSILVLFFRLRLIPSMPIPGEPRALGLDRAWSDVRFSAQTVPTQGKGSQVKTWYFKDSQPSAQHSIQQRREESKEYLCRKIKAFSCHLIRYPSFRWVQGQTCIIKPLLQQWLKFAHVFKAQVQGLKARDGSLAEVISIQLPHGQANIPLVSRRKTEAYIRNVSTINLTHSNTHL